MYDFNCFFIINEYISKSLVKCKIYRKKLDQKCVETRMNEKSPPTQVRTRSNHFTKGTDALTSFKLCL